MWTSTVGLVNGKHRYLTAETFGFKISSNGQQLKRRQQWTIEPFPENTGPDGSISSAASVSSQATSAATAITPQQQHQQQQQQQQQQPIDPNDPCILTLASGPIAAAGASSASNAGSSSSEQDACGEEHENVAIKSHLNKYLAVDSFGNVTCDSDEKSESARFTITICSMSQGRSKEEHIFWAFKNVERGYYLGTTDDGMICCSAKMPKSRAELWHLHLLPARGASFFAIKSLGRKRFARVTSDHCEPSSAPGQVQLDANISWGPETLFQFQYFEGGKFALLTSDQRLLTNEGKILAWTPAARGDEPTTAGGGGGDPLPANLPPPECLFTLEYHSGYLAFRDSFGQYLAAAGRSSVLRSRSIGVSRDELFVFEPAPIQVSLKATFNNRWVSIRQGVDLSANQADITSKCEIFQMTYHKQTQLWSIMTHDCNFWTISQPAAGGSNTISVCRPGDYEGLTRGQFKLIWSDSDASFCMKHVGLASQQERWLSARKSGQLYLAASGGGGGTQAEPVKFILRFQNRRLLNLRPVEGSGFVGLKSLASRQLECTKAAPEPIEIEYSDQQLAQTDGLGGVGSCAATTAARDQSAGSSPRVINVFNVKLNQTKMSPSVFDKLNSAARHQSAAHTPTAKANGALPADGELGPPSPPPPQQRLGADFGIDANNNSTCGDFEKPERGGVESAAAPSVASIISSFSSAKINGTGPSELQQQQQQQNGANSKVMAARTATTGSSAVSKLASSFELPPSQAALDRAQPPLAEADAEAPSADKQTAMPSGGQIDQVAQLECCHMKMRANNRYLVVQGGGSGGASISCDATNKACAQAWILELRSHSSIAIRASDNHAYLQLGTNGTISLARCEPHEATLWEF